MDVYICFRNLPKVFRELESQSFELNKVVVAVNKLTPGTILPYHGTNIKHTKKEIT